VSGFVHDPLADNPGDATLATGLDVGSEVDGLVGYYPFDGDATDKTELGNDGTVNGATFNGSGQVGGDSLLFDGADDSVDIPNSPAQDWTQSHTFAWWQQYDASDTHSPFIGTRSSDGSTTEALTWVGDDAAWDYRTETGSAIYTSTTLTDGNWHHLALVNRSGTVEFWVDGTKQSTASAALSSTDQTTGVRVGEDYTSNYGKGSIDDLRLYARPLSPQEITALSNRTATSPVPTEATL